MASSEIFLFVILHPENLPWGWGDRGAGVLGVPVCSRQIEAKSSEKEQLTESIEVGLVTSHGSMAGCDALRELKREPPFH